MASAIATNPFFAAMDARRLGENDAPELSASGVGEPLVALFFKLVRGLPDTSLGELMAAVDKKDAFTAAHRGDPNVSSFCVLSRAARFRRVQARCRLRRLTRPSALACLLPPRKALNSLRKRSRMARS